MKARVGLFLITVAMVGLIAFSGICTPTVLGSSEAGERTISTYDKSPVVRSHKITENELKSMEKKLGVSIESQNYNEIVEGHGTGLRAPTVSEWQEISKTAQITESVSLQSAPSNVDNTLLPWFPPLANQGSQGSCVAFSVGYYAKTFQEAKERGWNLSGAKWEGSYPGAPTVTYQDRIMSPKFVYNLIDGGTDNGGSLESAISVVCSIGISSWQKMPYSQVDYSTWPAEPAWAEAPYYRGNDSGYQYLNFNSSSGIQCLKNLLAAGTLVSIGVDADLFTKFTSTDFWTLDNYSPADNSSINHANTVVGYDDNIAYNESGLTRQGAFKVVNSWGTGSWEHVADGFYWISYETMRQRVGATSDGIFFYDSIGYQPELLASFKIVHPYRGECQIVVGAGSRDSPIVTKSFTQALDGGNFSFPQNDMMLDITEFKTALPRFANQSYFLEVNDSGTSTLGTIASFSIGNVSSLDPPCATINNTNVFVTLFYSVTVQDPIPEFASVFLLPLMAAVALLAVGIKQKLQSPPKKSK